MPFYTNEECRRDATRLSLIYLFENGSKINRIFNHIGNKFVENETLFNMIKQNTNMNTEQKIQLLIDYKFDFLKLFNICDNIKQSNGLIQLTTYHFSYSSIRLLLNYCKTYVLKQCMHIIDIAHCDTNVKMHYFTHHYLISKRFHICYPTYVFQIMM